MSLLNLEIGRCVWCSQLLTAENMEELLESVWEEGRRAAARCAVESIRPLYLNSTRKDVEGGKLTLQGGGKGKMRQE